MLNYIDPCIKNLKNRKIMLGPKGLDVSPELAKKASMIFTSTLGKNMKF